MRPNPTRFLFVTLLILGCSHAAYTQTYHVVPTQQLTSEGESDNYNFGASVAYHNNRLVVGAEQRRGVVELYERQPNGQWQRKERILGAANGHIFGNSVAIDEDVFAAAQLNASGQPTTSGVVSIYKKQGPTWSLDVSITPPKPISGGLFGRKMLFLGPKDLLISMLRANSDTDKIGAVYYYQANDQGQWTLKQTITPSPEAFNLFGTDMAYHDGTLVVSAAAKNDQQPSQTPLVFIFQRNAAGDFEQVQSINAPKDQTYFGAKLAYEGKHLLVSGYELDEARTVYHYTLPDDLSTPITAPQELAHPAASLVDQFGNQMMIKDGVLVVTNPASRVEQTRTLIYRLEGDKWTYGKSFYSTFTGANGFTQTQRYGNALAVSDDQIFIGASRRNTSRGALYVYNLSHLNTEALALNVTDASLGWQMLALNDILWLSAPLIDQPFTNSGGTYAYDPGTDTITTTTASGLAPNVGYGTTMVQNDNYVVVSAPGARDVFVFPKNQDGTIGPAQRSRIGNSDFAALNMHLSADNTLYIQRISYGMMDVITDIEVKPYEIASNNTLNPLNRLPNTYQPGEHFGAAIYSIGPQVFVGNPRIAGSGTNGTVHVFNKTGDRYQEISVATSEGAEGFGSAITGTSEHIWVSDSGRSSYIERDLQLNQCGRAGALYQLTKSGTWQVSQTISSPTNEADCFGTTLSTIDGHVLIHTPLANTITTNYANVVDVQRPGGGLLFMVSEHEDQSWRISGGFAVHEESNEGFGRAAAKIQDTLFVSSTTLTKSNIHKITLPLDLTAPQDNLITGDVQPMLEGKSSPGAQIKIELVQGPDAGRQLTAKTKLSGRWQYTFEQALQTGVHTIEVQAHIDDFLLSPKQTRTITVDAKLPSTPEITAPANETFTNDAQQAIEGTTGPTLDVTCTWTGPSGTPIIAMTKSDAQGQWRCQPPMTLEDDEYNVAVIAKSPLGNESAPATIKLTVDTTAPAAPTLEDLDQSTTKPIFKGQGEANATLYVALNVDQSESTTLVSVEGQWQQTTPIVLPDNAIYLAQIWQVDRAGNRSEVTERIFDIGENIDVQAQPNNPPNLEGVLSEASDVRLLLKVIRDQDEQVIEEKELRTDEQGQWQYSLPTVIEPGVYTIALYQLDDDGQLEAFQGFKISVRYIAESFERGYCQHTPVGGPGGGWLLMFGLCVGGLVRTRRRMRATRQLN